MIKSSNICKAYSFNTVKNNRPIDLSLVLKEQLEAYPLSRHFDVARIIVDQAVR